MPWFCALNRKTSRVDTMTDARGAHAEIQKNFGHLMLCLFTCRKSDEYVLQQELANTNNCIERSRSNFRF